MAGLSWTVKEGICPLHCEPLETWVLSRGSHSYADSAGVDQLSIGTSPTCQGHACQRVSPSWKQYQTTFGWVHLSPFRALFVWTLQDMIKFWWLELVFWVSRILGTTRILDTCGVDFAVNFAAAYYFKYFQCQKKQISVKTQSNETGCLPSVAF